MDFDVFFLKLCVKQNQDDIKKQFEGYFDTPQLWSGNLMSLQQLTLPAIKTTKFNQLINNKLRLGKRVERFMSYELNLRENITILSENHQVQDDKITVGELDFILTIDDTPVHLEVVYKYYLLDYSVGESEIEHCIGPNKKDNLLKKLTKLKDKQLPLLYHPKTKPHIDNLGISLENLQQFVFFKAELFLPIHNSDFSFKELNKNCVKGIYFKASDLPLFSDCKFHIPTKNKLDTKY